MTHLYYRHIQEKYDNKIFGKNISRSFWKRQKRSLHAFPGEIRQNFDRRYSVNRTDRKKARKKIKSDLRQSLKQGALLYMDGKLAAPSQISDSLVRENGGYMADYVMDDAGHISEIHYDRIRI